ncbi:MAG: acyltransferase family protein [Proteobacteria bacterium]|nr:acyltransferase family protein [Pseudomonadota bacterium]
MTVLFLIPYHTARIFDSIPFYVKHEPPIIGLEVLRRFLDPWGMPLLFLIAGASSWFSLQSRTQGEFIRERAKRLLVPLAFGTLVLVPPQTYYAAVSKTVEFQKSFFQYYPEFFSIGGLDSLTGFEGTFTPAHLWFILYLFLFSIIALPAFRYLDTQRGRQHISQLARMHGCHTWGMFLFAIPLAFARLTGLPYPNPLFFFIVFLYGYIFCITDQFQEGIDKVHPMAIMLAVLGLILFYVIKLSGFSRPPQPSFGAQYVLFEIFHAFNTWAWILVLLGLGKRYLNFPHTLLTYLNEGSYPIYVLQQTVIVVAGFYLLQWQINVVAKFGPITLTSTFLILSLYAVAVKRTGVTRFLFGMKAGGGITTQEG